MGRKKTQTDDVLDGYYFKILDVLKDQKDISDSDEDTPKSLYMPELCRETGLTEGQIKKATNHGRRMLGDKRINISQYVLGSNKGYFLPDYRRECIAYAVQHTKAIISAMAALEPLLNYGMERDKDAFFQAFKTGPSENYINDETTPWEIYDRVISSLKIINDSDL